MNEASGAPRIPPSAAGESTPPTGRGMTRLVLDLVRPYRCWLIIASSALLAMLQDVLIIVGMLAMMFYLNHGGGWVGHRTLPSSFAARAPSSRFRSPGS